ncbi:MAG: hypothetical protein ABSH28_19935 [Acidobacteriota bacterium]
MIIVSQAFPQAYKSKKIFQATHSGRQIPNEETRHIGNFICDPILEILTVQMNVSAGNPLAGSIRRFRRIVVSRPIEIESGQHDDFPGTGLILESNPVATSAFNGQEKLLTTVRRMKQPIVVHRLTLGELKRLRIHKFLGHLQ